MVSKSTKSESSGNLLEMQIFMPYPRPTKSQAIGFIPAICTVASLPGDADAQWRLRIAVGDKISGDCFGEQKTLFPAVTELKGMITDWLGDKEEVK